MTNSQQESLYFIYVNVANATIYSEDLLKDNTVSKAVKDSVRVIHNKLNWIKVAMELKTDSKIIQSVDTLRYDELFRLLAKLDDKDQDTIEKIIVEYIKQIP
jgi:hypothetical protein